jgi:hypothetical protein
MLKEKLKLISSLLRLGASVDAFLGTWTSSVISLAGGNSSYLPTHVPSSKTSVTPQPLWA